MPDYMVPFVPMIHEDDKPFAVFEDLNKKDGKWVLDVLKYDLIDNLLTVFSEAVVSAALELSEALLIDKTKHYACERLLRLSLAANPSGQV